MEQDKTLQALFTQFEQNMPDLMSIEEVEQTIGKIVPQKHRSFKKTIINMSILSTIAISVIIMLNLNNNKINSGTINTDNSALSGQISTVQPEKNDLQNKTEAEAITSPNNGQILTKENRIHNEAKVENTEPSNKGNVLPEEIVMNQSNAGVKAEQQNSVAENMQTQGDVMQVNEPQNTLVKVDEKPQATFLRLNDEELFKLGIVGKDGGIFYEETYNRNKPFTFSMIVKGKSFSNDMSGGTMSILTNADKYPFMITDKYLGLVSSPLNRKEMKDTMQLLNNYKYYLPIIVSNKLTDPNPDFPNELIFWFPKSDYIKALMPQWVQETLAKDPDALSWDLRTGREYRTESDTKVKKIVRSEVLIRDPENINVIGDGKVIAPDKVLLDKLGFYYDDSIKLGLKLKYKRFYYKVYQEGLTTHINSDCPSKEYFKKVQENYAMPVPLYVSDSLCEMRSVHSLASGNDGKENVLQSLINMKHLMTPVKVKFSPYYTKYFWYMNDAKFLNKLNDEQKMLVESIMKDSAKNKMVLQMAEISADMPAAPDLQDIYKFKENSFDKVNTISIEGNETEKLGYKIVDNDLRLFIKKGIEFNKENIGGDSFLTTMLTHTKHGTIISEGNLDKRFSHIITPVYISDDLGKYTYISIIEDSSNGGITFDNLIPVLVKTGRKYNTIDMVNKAARPDYLLWYKATPEFLSLLPQQVKEDIQKELKTVVTDSGSKVLLPCKYTDVCKQRKENILKVNTYPNPATNVLNIDIEFKSALPCTLSFADLSGKVLLQKIWTPDSLNAGTTIQTGSLASGIYYLYISTSAGDLIVQKILINH